MNLRYVPKKLSKNDKKNQIKMIKKSKKMYKKGQYQTRKKLISFQSKESSHIKNAKKIYKVKKIGATAELAKKTGCSKKTLRNIIKKGQGAYYSSGSRPNQTSHSWGIARLASTITSGKAAAVDFNMLKEGCNNKSKALLLAKKAKKKHGHGTRKVPKIKK